VQIDRTIPNNKPGIIICDERSQEDSEMEIPYNRNTVNVECKNKCGTSNNMGNWNILKIIQKVPEQRTRKAQNQGTTENSHIGHCTHTWESINIKVQYI
jgi:hypothetical protein